MHTYLYCTYCCRRHATEFCGHYGQNRYDENRVFDPSEGVRMEVALYVSNSI